MRNQRDRGGFTLIEVLIVVVIMSILAATIIPQFSTSTKDAKESTIRFNLNTMRSQIELYKLHHVGLMPDGTNNLKQLTSSTDATGTLGTAGASFPYGPYIQTALPSNPMTGSNTVTLFTGTGTPTASGSTTAGWIYRASTGEIWCDNSAYITW